MSRKLMAKGNERLPFAWRCVLCEGESDVEAVFALAERLGVDPRAQNIAVADCGGATTSRTTSGSAQNWACATSRSWMLIQASPSAARQQPPYGMPSRTTRTES
jgi:hypothetical protein